MIKHSTKIWVQIRLAIFVLVPIALFALPADFFDEGPRLCFSVMFLGRECPGCGMTRAVMHLIHLEFREACFYNRMSFAVFPLLAWYWAKWFLKDWGELKRG
ncbi:MAG TPA: DUF2752 domain-containing protein [Bacteroidetes bacterium]|nr:DUF2752 domain-containing protein [Bacteroidota bacterium]